MLAITVLSLLTGSGLLVITLIQWVQQNQLAQQEEEEVLTQYQSKENVPPTESSSLSHSTPESGRGVRQLGWEFKILRASRNLFQNPNILQRVCEEEAKAGWILLEKLDERRLRFKRPMALRELIKPETLKYDPYRCHYGTFNPVAWLGGIALFGVMAGSAYLGYTMFSIALTQARNGPTIPTSPEFSR